MQASTSSTRVGTIAGSVVSLLAALALSACATSPFAPPVTPGAPRADVISRMGQPQRVVPLPQGGERLQYSEQPIGHRAYMADIDPSGRVIGFAQVLTEQNFNRIQPGWTAADVEREFGRPAWVDRVASWNGPVMTYRWRDTVNTNMFYYVYLDPAGVVRRAHPGIEFINSPNDKN